MSKNKGVRVTHENEAIERPGSLCLDRGSIGHSASAKVLDVGSRSTGYLPFILAMIILLVPLIAICWLEPVVQDGWYQYRNLLQKHPWDFGRLFHRVERNYFNGNPRIGEVLVPFLYESKLFHSIATPVMIFCVYVGIFILALGRFPRPKSWHDAYLLLMIGGLAWLSIPAVGVAFFLRTITANYVYGFALLLLYFIPFRLAWGAGRPARDRFWRCSALFLFGIVAGMTNEHTVPTALVASAAMIVFFALRDRQRLRIWMYSGTTGLALGFLLLFFAPGQNKRYGSMGESSLVSNVLRRGPMGNVALVDQFVRDMGPMLLMIIGMAYLWLSRSARGTSRIPIVRKPPLRRGLVLACAAALMFGTTLLSPIVGHRLFFAPMCLMVAAAMVAIDALASARLAKSVSVTIALAALLVLNSQAFVIYRTTAFEFKARCAKLASASPNSVVRLTPYRYWRRSRFFYGDDFRSATHRKLAAECFGIRGVILDYDKDDPLAKGARELFLPHNGETVDE
jgi:hypothetical protein